MQQVHALKILLVLLAAVFTAPSAWAFNGCNAADVTGDGVVNDADLREIDECMGGPSPRKDLNGDGVVDEEDLELVQDFLNVDCSTWCPADFNGDERVTKTDRNLLVGSFGEECVECPFDLNDDGAVDTNDLWFLLASCGPCDPEPLTLLSRVQGGIPNPCAEGPDGQ